MRQNSTEFEPSENQKAVLEAFRERDYVLSVTDACRTAGVHRSTFYLWFQDAGFRAWWNNEADRWATLQRPRIIGAMVAAATSPEIGVRGSASDRKLFLERYDEGYSPKSRRQVSGGLDVDATFRNMTDEELRRLDEAVRDEVPADNEPVNSEAADPVGAGEADPVAIGSLAE